MGLINKRYRILSKIYQHKYISTYLVSDLNEGFKVKLLHLIDENSFTIELLKNLNEVFVEYSNINTKSILKIYEFDVLKWWESDSVKEIKYFMTTEYIEGSKNIIDFSNEITEENFIEVFVEFLRAINYAHLKGYVYKNINPFNIRIKKENGKVKVYLNNLIKSHFIDPFLDKYDINLYFKSKEILKGQHDSKDSDIYAIGVIAAYLITGNIISGEEIRAKGTSIFKEDVNRIKVSDQFINKFYSIMFKMTDSLEKRYKSINEIIDDINFIFNKDYRKFDLKELEILKFKNAFIGREDEKRCIQQGIEDNYRIFKVHGEGGIGKSRFLSHMGKCLNMHNVDVFTIYNKKNFNNGYMNDFYVLIKKVLSSSSTQIVEKYRDELEKVIPEFGENRNLNVDVIYRDKEKIISRLSNFIYETLKDRKVIFIVDNINSISEFLQDFILYNIEKYREGDIKKYDFYFIFSYSDEEIIYNNKLKNFLYYIGKYCYKNKEIKIKGLKELEVISLLNRIFGIRSKEENLTFITIIKKVVKKCYGNPLFIEETIKDLFLNEYIYINDKGLWSTKDKICNYELPYSIKEATLNQLKTIDIKSLYILKYISLFPKRGVSYKEIENSNKGYKVNEILNYLVNKGILICFYEGKDLIYDFSNRLLKRLVYDSMGEDEKYLMHKKVVSYLKKYSLINFYDDEEFIFHLERTKDYDKVINYSILFANKLKKQGNIKKEIYYIEKALNISKKINGNLNKRYILTLRLGRLYYRYNNFHKSFTYYKKALNISIRLSDLKKKVDVLNSILSIYSETSDLKKAFLVIKRIDEILKCIDYKKGKLDMLVIKSNLCFLKGDQVKTIDTCQKGLEVCDQYKSDHKGKLYNILGNVELNNANYNNAEKFYKLAYENLKEFYNVDGVARVLNNLGICNIYLTGSHGDPKKYFIEAKKIYEEKGYISETILPSYNLAEAYSKINNYEESILISKETLNICDEHKINIGYLLLCNQIFKNCFIIGKYKEAFYYYYKAGKYIKHNKANRFDVLDFYYNGAMFFYELKDYEKSIENIDKYLKICEEISYEGYDDLIILKHMIEFEKSYIDKKLKNNKEFLHIISIIKCFENEVVREEFYIKLLHIVKYDEDSLQLLWKEILNSNKNKSLSERFIFEKYYFSSKICKENKLEYLNEVLKNGDKNIKPILFMDVYGELGKYYLEEKDIYNAINNYVYALKILRKITKEVPEELRINFIKYNNLWALIEHILKVEEMFLNKNSFNINLDEITVESFGELFQFNMLKKLFKNNNFRKIYIEGHEKNMGEKIKNKEDIIKEITSSPKINLENILKYLVEISLTTLGSIVFEKNNKLEVLASTEKNYKFRNQYIVNKCKLEKKEVILDNKVFQEEELRDLQDIEVAICIPIPLNNLDDNMNAYIYVESDKLLYNLNNKFVGECKSLFNLLQFIIESYLNQLDANYDKLTMAFTRKYLEQCLNASIKKAEKNNKPLSIIMFDIDDFKKVNDKHGHKTGDLVLREVSKTVLSQLQENEFLGRYGGEEFVIILEDTDAEKAYLKSEKIRKSISSNLDLKNNVRVTVSLGVASYPMDSTSLWNLVGKADVALYNAKETGKDKTVQWSSSFVKEIKQNDEISWILKEDYIKDHSYMATLFECIDIINTKMHADIRRNTFLDKILTLFEGECISLFILDKEKSIKKRICRKSSKIKLANNYFNEKLLEKSIRNQESTMLVDWSDIKERDPVTNIPNCYSVIINPLVKNGELRGVLYLKVPVKIKEFSVKEFNFTKVLCKLLVNI